MMQIKPKFKIKTTGKLQRKNLLKHLKVKIIIPN